MAGETVITVTGNLVGDPEVRFTASGAAVANFTVASTPRKFDKDSGSWRDGEALFMRCSVWRQVAENVSETLTRGMRVIVTGSLEQRSFKDKDGVNRTVIEMRVEEVGPSLRYATAKVNKAAREGASNYQQAPSRPAASGPTDDPWASNSVPAGQQGTFAEEPPF